MSLKKRVYSVLIVSAKENFNHALQDLLPPSKYSPVRFAANIRTAGRALAERSYDYVIINSPLPDDAGARFAMDVSNTGSAVALLLIPSEVYEEIHDRVAEHGVFTLAKPTSKLTVLTALNWLSSARERLRKMEKKTSFIEEKMAEIRLVNKAKWLLIRNYNMDEPAAHRHIEKKAMDRCISRRTVAEEIIQRYS